MKALVVGWQGITHIKEIGVWFIVTGKNNTRVDHVR
jgi:hypothetical protein